MLVVVTGYVALQQPPIMLNALPILKREYPRDPYVASGFLCVWELVLEVVARYLELSQIYLDMSLILVKSRYAAALKLSRRADKTARARMRGLLIKLSRIFEAPGRAESRSERVRSDAYGRKSALELCFLIARVYVYTAGNECILNSGKVRQFKSGILD